MVINHVLNGMILQAPLDLPQPPQDSRRSRRMICRKRATSKKAQQGIRKRPGLNNTLGGFVDGPLTEAPVTFMGL